MWLDIMGSQGHQAHHQSRRMLSAWLLLRNSMTPVLATSQQSPFCGTSMALLLLSLNSSTRLSRLRCCTAQPRWVRDGH